MVLKTNEWSTEKSRGSQVSCDLGMPKGKTPRQAFCSANVKWPQVFTKAELMQATTAASNIFLPGEQQDLIFENSSELNYAFRMVSSLLFPPFPHQYMQHWEQTLESQVRICMRGRTGGLEGNKGRRTSWLGPPWGLMDKVHGQNHFSFILGLISSRTHFFSVFGNVRG